MVDNLGFPVFSQIYRGNQGEPETLAHALDRLEKDLQAIGTQDFRPTLVMDRGIATKGNLKLLKERGFPFTVIERKKIGKEKISHFKEMEGFQEYKIQGGKIQLKKLESEETASVLVKSLFLPDRVMKRIGRISERHPSMGKFYHLEVEKDETGKVVTAIHFRVTGALSPEVKEIFKNLGIQSPFRRRLTELQVRL